MGNQQNQEQNKNKLKIQGVKEKLEIRRIKDKLEQNIIEACLVKRKINIYHNGFRLCPIKHQGVLVKTAENQMFMIHLQEPDKVVVSEKSSKEQIKEESWKLVEELKVNSQITLRQAEMLGGKGTVYFKNLACIGVGAMQIEEALVSLKYQIKDKLKQKIVAAFYIKRKISSSRSGYGFCPIKHFGIQVRTDENQNYIIHHPGPDKNVVLERFSKKKYEQEGWKLVEKLEIDSQLTIGQAEIVAGKGKCQLKNLACIGVVAMKIEEALGSLKYQIKDKLEQKIVAAFYIKRNLNSSGSGSGFGPIKHFGIQVRTDEYQNYIIHHLGPGKDVVSQKFSKKKYEQEGWKLVEKLEIDSQITLGQAEMLGGKGTVYLQNLACIGVVAMKIEEALESLKYQIKDKLEQKIVAAFYIKRNLNSSGSGSGFGPIKHFGIQVRTDEYQNYIIHHLGPGKDVVSQKFSKKKYEQESWELVKVVEVNSQLTISQAEEMGGKGEGYLQNLTCIGVANKIEEALESLQYRQAENNGGQEFSTFIQNLRRLKLFGVANMIVEQFQNTQIKQQGDIDNVEAFQSLIDLKSIGVTTTLEQLSEYE